MSFSFLKRDLEQSVARVVVLLLAALCSATTSFAQQEAAQIGTQQDVARPTLQNDSDQETEPSVADPDLGEINLVRHAPRPKMFTFWTNQEFHYTSNAFLAPQKEQNTFYWNGRIDAAFVPYSTRDFTPRLTFEQNFFRYDKFSQLDFDSQSLQLDLKYDLKRDDSWFVNVSYSIARLYTPRGDANEFYKFGLANASITNVRQLGGLPLYLTSTFGSQYRHGDPSGFDRVTAFGNAALFYSPLEHLQLVAFARPEGQFYTNDPVADDRFDFNVSAGVSAVVNPNEYVSFTATASYVGNYSSSEPADYQVFSPALVIGARVAF